MASHLINFQVYLLDLVMIFIKYKSTDALFSDAPFVHLVRETRDSYCILSTSNLQTLHSTFLSLFYLCQMTCICLYTTLVFLKPTFPFSAPQSQAQHDLGEVPSVKHSSVLPVSFVHTFTEHQIVLCLCILFPTRLCILQRQQLCFTSYNQHMSICSMNADYWMDLYHMLSSPFPPLSMFFTSPFVSMCGHPLKFDCCKALPQSK